MCEVTHFQFKNYSTAEGLAGNNVWGVFQDSRKFLWIRTSSGLSKFDGIACQNYSYNPVDSDGIGSNEVYAIAELSQDIIILGTNNGLSLYNNHLCRFENWRIKQSGLRCVGNAFVKVIKIDNRKNVWIFYNGIIDVFDSLLHFKFRYTETESGKKLKGMDAGQVSMENDSSGNMWISSDNMGLVSLNCATLQSSIIINPEYSSTKTPAVVGVYVDRNKSQVWYSIYGFGLFCFDINKKTTKHFILHNDNIFNQAQLNTHRSILPFKNYLYCSSGKGVVVFNINSETYEVIPSSGSNSYSLPSEIISQLYIDQSGLLWVSSDRGLSKCNLGGSLFKYYSLKNIGTPSGDINTEIISFKVYNTDWFILGTLENGIFAFNKVSGEIKHYYVRHPANVSENCFSRIFIDRQNKIWVSSYEGLRIYNLEKNTIQLPPPEFSNLHNGSCIAFLEDSKGDYWMSYEGDPKLIHCFRDAGGVHQENFNYEDGSFPLKKISTIKEDKEGNIWLATLWGLGIMKWTRKSNSFERLPRVKSPNEYLGESYSDLWPQDSCTVWLTSALHGLEEYNSVLNSKNIYGVDNGFPSNSLMSLFINHDGKIWISSDNGISRFDTATKEIRNYSYDDGLPETEFAGKFLYDTISRLLYLRTAGNIIYFNPDSILADKKSDFNPALYLKSMEVNGNQLPGDFDHTLELSNNENNIALEFSGITYQNADKLKFEYQLLGLDEKWIRSGNRRYVTYANLQPGFYSFQVRSSIDNATWGAPVTIATFRIAVPVYLRWWFLSSLFLILSSAGFLLYTYRNRNKKALENIRSRIARDLHDDIGSTLTSISIFSDLVKMKNTDEQHRIRLLDTMGQSSRNMIDQMNDIVWTVNPLNDSFENILLRMKNFANEITEGRNIKMVFEIDELCNGVSLPMDKRKNFYLIFKEAVNNAIKYSACRNLIIKITRSKKELRMEVIDDGEGFEQGKVGRDHEHSTLRISGNGLQNMTKRAFEIKAELKIISKVNVGTNVILKMKV